MTDSRPAVVQSFEASAESMFSKSDYVGAAAAYPSWPGTCLIAGFVATAGKHRALAEQVRDRWVKEGAPRLGWNRRLIAAPKFDSR